MDGQRKPKRRDDRDFDTTAIRENSPWHRDTLHRDYSAHFFRWSFARRFVRRTDDVLEVGCGVDRPLVNLLTRSMVRLVGTYTGVDLNEVKPCGFKGVDLRGGFDFTRRWAELRRPDGYDVAIHLEVIEHMKVGHGRRLLRGCHELLRPGGAMLMSTPCYDGRRHAANHIHEYTVDELRREVERAGFEVTRRFGTFVDVRHIGKASVLSDGAIDPQLSLAASIVKERLACYFDNDALANIFGPLYPDHARNNLWIARKPK